MTSKQIAMSVGFGLFWAAFMVWWSSDFSIAHIAILSVMGLLVGFAWTYFMKRFGYLT